MGTQDVWFDVQVACGPVGLWGCGRCGWCDGGRVGAGTGTSNSPSTFTGPCWQLWRHQLKPSVLDPRPVPTHATPTLPTGGGLG